MDRPITILSYNLLAQKYVDPYIETRYGGIKDKSVLAKSYRFNLLYQQINSFSPDICCFQEVELDQIDTDFADYFAVYDHRCHKISKDRNNPIGNITMWKRDLFNLVKPELKSSSCAILTKLECTKINFSFVLCNVHLKAGGNNDDVLTKISQIRSCINKSQINKLDPVCICGDFNDELSDDSALRHEIESKNFVISEPQLTFYSYENDEYYSFDQVCGYHLRIDVNPYPKLEPIPSTSYPSDHFPLIFTISPK